MHGFIVSISLKGDLPDINYLWKSLFDFQSKHINRKFRVNNLQIEQFTGEKFLSEKLWIDNDDFFIVTDGLITNIDTLQEKYNTNDYESLIRILSQKKTDFFREFTGNFVGFLWNKRDNIFLAFNNQTGTKKLFYYKSTEYLIFSTDLFTLSQTLKQLTINKSLDVEASYLLLTSGFMHEDYTLIKEVKQITAGKYAFITDNKFTIKTFYNLRNIKSNTDSEKEIINKLDTLFKEAIRIEFDFDRKHSLTPLTTLSGGLDSRMVALFAYDFNFHNQELLNFSERGYADEVIAKKIAHQYQININLIPLSSRGLLAIDDVVAVNDGLTLYSGAGHVFEAIKIIKQKEIGLLHTGILGDAILGSYLSKKQHRKPFITDGVYSDELIKKTQIIQNSIYNYPNEVLYKLYNRGFLGVNNGFLFFDLLGESMSPFLYPAFLNYALSIPPKFCFKEKIYIKWIKTKHPEYARFVWEAIGGKPTNNQILRLFYRYKRAIIKRLPFQSMWKNNMNPEQLWYDKNPDVKEYLDNYFENNISKFEFNKELMADMRMLYHKGKITEKTQVLTLLSAYKLLFEK